MRSKVYVSPKFCNIPLMLTIMLLLLLSGRGYSDERVFRLSHDDYKPYHWYDEEEKRAKGILVDICEEVLGKRLGYKVVYTNYPWKRAQHVVQMGTDDAFITVATPERLEYVQIGEQPFLLLDRVLFTQINHPRIEEMKKIKTLKELQPYRILDYSGNGWGKKWLVEETGLAVDYAPNMSLVLKKLAMGRGDVFIEDSKATNYTLMLLQLRDKVVALPVVFNEIEFMLCISKKSPFKKDISKIDKVVKEIKNDGTLEAILGRWK